MKDYSEFIRDEFGFITSIKPNLETKKIEVITSMSKKNQPHVYELNRKNIQKLYGRLEQQYQLLIENKDSILKQLEEKREKKLKVVDYTSIGLSVALIVTALLSSGLNFLFAVGLIPAAGTITSTIIVRTKFKKDFESMIETYNYFINNKEEIEALAKQDENVINGITMDSYQKLKSSEELVTEELTDEQYTIGLIDNLSLKDLRAISLRYKISKALDSEPYFYIEQPKEIIGEPVFEETNWKDQAVVKSKYDLPEQDENNQDKNQSHTKTLHK